MELVHLPCLEIVSWTWLGGGRGKGHMCRLRDKWDGASAFKVAPAEDTGSRCPGLGRCGKLLGGGMTSWGLETWT